MKNKFELKKENILFLFKNCTDFLLKNNKILVINLLNTTGMIEKNF